MYVFIFAISISFGMDHLRDGTGYIAWICIRFIFDRIG